VSFVVLYSGFLFSCRKVVHNVTWEGTIVAIMALTKRKLKRAGANSEETAKTPKELALNEKWLKTCVRAGVVATQNGRYYILSNKKKKH